MLRRPLGKALVVFAFPAALALPAYAYLGPSTCGEELTLATAALFFSSPLSVLAGWVLLVARRPRSVGYWAVPIALGIPFWYVAALSTGCSVE